MTCIHIIINALIIIFVLHFIISSINFNQILGNPNKTVERFSSTYENTAPHKGLVELDSSLENKNIQLSDSIKFLTEDTQNELNERDDDFKKKLMSFIQKKEDSNNQEKFKSFEEKNVLPVLPSNSFTSNENIPNFESNVLNVQKFYKRDLSGDSLDNLDEKQLKKASERYSNEISHQGRVLKETPIPNLADDVNDSRDNYGRISTKNPPTWQYKNELPMNGGNMGGIVGFDSLESQFQLFNGGELNMQPTNSANFDIIPHDDLRKPIVYEN